MAAAAGRRADYAATMMVVEDGRVIIGAAAIHFA
jgi:hypothetical protein